MYRPGPHLAAESAEETQKQTEKKKKKKGSERALTRISRKTRKDANEFLKIKKCSRALFFTAFCVKIHVSLCVFGVFSGELSWSSWYAVSGGKIKKRRNFHPSFL